MVQRVPSLAFFWALFMRALASKPVAFSANSLSFLLLSRTSASATFEGSMSLLTVTMSRTVFDTIFAVGSGGRYDLRWFTPGGEVDLCGHATLAAGFVILNLVEP